MTVLKAGGTFGVLLGIHTHTDFVVVSGTVTQRNHNKLALNLCEQGNEDADTFLILHAIDASKDSSVKQLDVCSSDTDLTGKDFDTKEVTVCWPR